ncbi:energy-coupling factor transporter transmembrane component T family protein [Aeromicrobium sp. CF3.5]|uniref:energy-coupling factor transporter transmembrane component T family protein n=1 Tax=Aeromicrobium sp. CF3.5 TaxID=3373078 RepID=UPI003EE63DD2
MRAVSLGVHHPGTTVLHRIPAGPKLGLLVAYGLVVVALRGPWPPTAALGASVLLAASARVPLRDLWRGLRPMLLIVAVLAGFQAWQRGWPVAVEIAATVLALVLAATTFTATTPTDRLLDAIVRGLGPFRRLGVNPEKVALAFSLMIAALPRIADIAAETRDAARARGLERSPRAYLIPLTLRTVAHAHATGDALAARGLGDE